MFTGGGEDFTDKRRLSWLVRTAKNYLLDQADKWKHEIPIHRPVDTETDDEPDESDLFSIIEDRNFILTRKEKLNQICRNMIEYIRDNLKMDELEKIIFERRDCDGERIDKIADDLGIKPNTLAQKHKRLLNKIKEHFIKVNINSLSYFDFETV